MRKRIESFAYAFRGIAALIRLGANAKIRLVAAVLIMGLVLLLEFGI